MIKQRILNDLKRVVENLGYESGDTVCSVPSNPSFGDYSSNIALQLSKRLPAISRQSSVEIANVILSNLSHLSYLSKIEVAGGGFLNFFIKDEVLLQSLASGEAFRPASQQNKKYFLEYAQPNTHKAFHIGHLRNISLGESLARLLEFQGNEVFRASYGSDVGLPVAKALWGVQKLLEEYQQVQKGSPREKAEFLGKAYVLGAKTYEENEKVRKEINELNKQIYQKNANILPLWEETRQWSIDYFAQIFKIVDTKFNRLFWESEVDKIGKQIVEENIGKVFEKSDGAVIFPGEKYGLHNRVFITSAGNPTYEAKEMGLARLESEAFPYDEDWHIVGNEQEGYFKVIFKVLEILNPSLAKKNRHLSYGMVNLTTGKMSSRTGDVVTAESLLDQIKEKVKEVIKESRLDLPEQVVEQVSIGAAKFSMLRYSPGANISFDIKSSVALAGDSGPYLQYTYARSQSVLKEGEKIGFRPAALGLRLEELEEVQGLGFSQSGELSVEERLLLRRLEYFTSIVEQAAAESRPNLLCEYLLELAKDFNVFYQKHRIIQSEEKERRLFLTWGLGSVLKTGLNLLGIEAPSKM